MNTTLEKPNRQLETEQPEQRQPPSEPPPLKRERRRRSLLTRLRKALESRRREPLDPMLARQNELDRERRERQYLMDAALMGRFR